MSSAITEPVTVSPAWSEIGARLVAEFPQFAMADVLTELVQAHLAANYVGTPDIEQCEVVELMARFALKVRDGQVVPSDRLDPERHASPHRDLSSTVMDG